MLRVKIGLLKEKKVTEFIVIVESGADARTAIRLAARILVEKVDWLEDENLQYCLQWSGLQNGTQHSCWSDVKKIIDDAKEQLKYKPARFLGHDSKDVPLKADGAASREQQILQEITTRLQFDPCTESHRLRSTSREEPDRIRNPKVVVEQLTGRDMIREQQCWEDTSLELLRERGIHTGLAAYICEVEQRLIKIILSNDDNNTHTPTTPEP
jgi:hypothetical protein